MSTGKIETVIKNVNLLNIHQRYLNCRAKEERQKRIGEMNPMKSREEAEMYRSPLINAATKK